jgi:hypothetical protein
MKDICILCGNTAEKSRPDVHKSEYLFVCEICKEYIVDEFFIESYRLKEQKEKSMISAYTREYFEKGSGAPLLKDPDELKGIINRYKNKSFEDKINSFLIYIKNKSSRFGDEVPWNDKTDYPITYSIDSKEFESIRHYAIERSLIIKKSRDSGLILSGDGWQKAELIEKQIQSNKEKGRLNFLRKLNELSKGNVNEFIKTMTIADELGISRDDAFSFVRYYDQKELIIMRTDVGDTISITAKGIDEAERKSADVEIYKSGILIKLEELYSQKEVKDGFPSREACLEWTNKVAPLLKFSKEYYQTFMQNAQLLSLDLSSFRLEPAFRNMVNQLQMAIEEFRLTGGQNLALQNRGIAMYVNESRILELEALKNKEFDLSRLIRLLEEINVCFQNECYTAVALLVRAIIDHVPPIFKVKSFSEVANNYSGTKSFKESMDHLEKSCRRIADQQIHCQIRKSEVLPNQTQVDFKNDLDFLLSEIFRILK